VNQIDKGDMNILPGSLNYVIEQQDLAIPFYSTFFSGKGALST